MGAAIREKRHRVGKTLTEVAEITGISQSYLSQIERGEVTNPTIEVLFRILSALGENLLLEVGPAEGTSTDGSGTVYHSPFTLEELASLSDEYTGQDVVRLVQDVLKDPEIPLRQRKLLARQIKALLLASKEEIQRPDDI